MTGKIRIILDIGHGGPSNGATDPGNRPGPEDDTREDDLVLSYGLVALEVIGNLAGVELVPTRTTDVAVSFDERHRIAKGADLVISLHANAGGRYQAGSECYVSKWNKRSEVVAKAILGAMPTELKPGKLITVPDTAYPQASGLVAGYRPDTVLVEVGYLTSPDLRYLLSPAAPAAIAAALRAGLTKAIEIYEALRRQRS